MPGLRGVPIPPVGTHDVAVWSGAHTFFVLNGEGVLMVVALPLTSISGGLAGGATDQDPQETTASLGTCAADLLYAAGGIVFLWLFFTAWGAATLAAIGWASAFSFILLPLLLLIGAALWLWDGLRDLVWDMISEVWKKSRPGSVFTFFVVCIEGTAS